MALDIARCQEHDHPAAAYFARGSGHNEKSQYSERPDDFERTWSASTGSSRRRARAFRGRRWCRTGKSKIGIIAYGTSHWAIGESRDQLRKEYSARRITCALKAYPFTREVHEFIERHDRVYVVEQNRDAQMFSLLKLDLRPELIAQAASHQPHPRAADRCALRHRRNHDPWRASNMAATPAHCNSGTKD